MRPRAEGFALLMVLVLLAVLGLYTVATLQDAQFGTVLAGTRVVQQRAFVLAELGIENMLQELAVTAVPIDHSGELNPQPGSGDSVSVELRAIGEDALPPGFSAGRFVLQRFEIHSVGHAARGARSAQVQGAIRVQPARVASP